MRIIGGNAKGTLLSSPEGRNTRPTLGRVRESVFNVLANVGILETKVLDIFAGTGAMGLEALSRAPEKRYSLTKPPVPSSGKMRFAAMQQTGAAF